VVDVVEIVSLFMSVITIRIRSLSFTSKGVPYPRWSSTEGTVCISKLAQS